MIPSDKYAERAEKIFKFATLSAFGKTDFDKICQIESEIREAVEEAERALKSRTFSDSVMEQEADYEDWRKSKGEEAGK